jgi:hypothetical protein
VNRYDFVLRLVQERGDIQKVEKLKHQELPPYYGNDVLPKMLTYLNDLNNNKTCDDDLDSGPGSASPRVDWVVGFRAVP